MSFDSGSLSFRFFYLQQEYDSSLVTSFARRVIPDIEKAGKDPISGWIGCRHLLDREIADETCVIGPYLYVQLLKAERKIPASYLRAILKQEELLAMKAENAQFLTRKQKAEIKERVIEQLTPTMPPSLTAIPCVVDFRNDLLVAGAMSDKQIDALVPAFKSTVGSIPILLTPDSAAMKRKQVNAVDLNPVSFSPDPSVDPPATSILGQDFLTWLWFAWETGDNVWHLPDSGKEFGILLEGPVTFFREGEGVHEAVLRKGTPLNCAEAQTALLRGKKVKRLKFTIAQGEDIFACTLDDEFAFRGVKLPKGEQKEFNGKVEERMLFIETFSSALFYLFDEFLDLRTDSKKWKKTVADVRDWIQNVGEKQVSE